MENKKQFEPLKMILANALAHSSVSDMAKVQMAAIMRDHEFLQKIFLDSEDDEMIAAGLEYMKQQTKMSISDAVFTSLMEKALEAIDIMEQGRSPESVEPAKFFNQMLSEKPSLMGSMMAYASVVSMKTKVPMQEAMNEIIDELNDSMMDVLKKSGVPDSEISEVEDAIQQDRQKHTGNQQGKNKW